MFVAFVHNSIVTSRLGLCISDFRFQLCNNTPPPDLFPEIFAINQLLCECGMQKAGIHKYNL